MTTTEIPFNKSEEADLVASASDADQDGGGARNVRGYLRRPVALLSAAAVMGLTALGVITLGTLYVSEPTSVAASGMNGPAGGGGKISGGSGTTANISLGAKTYRLDEGGELVSE
jgi:hypothetical protein